MMTTEEDNFTREGVIRIYEKMLAGEMTEEDFHRAAENTEKLLKEDGGVGIKVKYMGVPKPDMSPFALTLLKHAEELAKHGIILKRRKPEPQQTKLFEEE